MPRPPYKFFTPLNNRRLELVKKKHYGDGLTKDEDREMEMLGNVVCAMADYRWPMKEIPPALKRLLAQKR